MRTSEAASETAWARRHSAWQIARHSIDPESHAAEHRETRSRLEQRQRRIGAIDNAGACDVFPVSEIATLDVGGEPAAVIVAGLQSPQEIRLGLQRIGAVDEVALRRPFDVGAEEI